MDWKALEIALAFETEKRKALEKDVARLDKLLSVYEDEADGESALDELLALEEDNINLEAEAKESYNALIAEREKVARAESKIEMLRNIINTINQEHNDGLREKQDRIEDLQEWCDDLQRKQNDHLETITAQNHVIQDLQKELDELQAVFDAQWVAEMRAIDDWQAANPGKHYVWPDHQKLVTWLIKEVEKYKAAYKRQTDWYKAHKPESVWYKPNEWSR